MVEKESDVLLTIAAMSDLIPRTLWFRDNRQTKHFSQEELGGLHAPIVVLGEAGMGKTRLLEWLSCQPGNSGCTARQLINRHDPRTLLGNSTTLVIDALDEVVARREGDAVDLVLQKLGELGYPPFVLSCRVADWQSATSVSAIVEQYPDRPLELHLEPFTEADAITFLTSRLSAQRANEVVEHFNRYGLRGFLGNPQTLEMIERVAPHGELPQTSSELFERTVDIIWKEHRDEKASSELTREQSLDASGAAFAALLLTGSEAISRGSSANCEEGELHLPDVEAFDSGRVSQVFGTRLFRGVGPDRFAYWHRRIGEYLGARWLVSRADTRGKRRRLLAMFHGGGLVPASLRGLHAWLALDDELAASVIAGDPMGVIEYGDADVLSPPQARQMMRSLRTVAEDNPRFRDRGPYRAQGLVQTELIAEVRAAIVGSDTPFGLKLLLLEQLERANVAAALRDELLSLALDSGHTFTERSSAADALRHFESPPPWPELVENLWHLADSDSTRLAVELVGKVGYDAFGDGQIADAVMAHCGLTLRSAVRKRRDHIVGTFTRLKRDLPADRSSGLLDVVTEYMAALVEKNGGAANELTDLVVELIARAVANGGVKPARLWGWLKVIREESGYNQRARESLARVLKADDELRRGVQRLVLLDGGTTGNIHQRGYRLGRRSSALFPSEDDLVALIGTLDPSDRSDMRWRELLELGRHDETSGADLRAAARAFAAHRRDLVEWIEKLAEPRVPEWEKKQERERRRRQAKKAAEWADDRAHFRKHVAEMRAGEFDYVVYPAKSYMKLFYDMGDDLEAHARVAEWLGTELAEAAHEGFEAFLIAKPPKPSAIEIARSIAESRRWEAGSIIVAALAERLRLGLGFEDLPAERIIAGWLEIRHREDEHAGVPGLREALVTELRRRSKWRSAQVLMIEPQLKKRRAHIEGLYELMHGDRHDALAADLALGWLQRLAEMAGEPERELITRVLDSPRRDALAAIARARLQDPSVQGERRRSWLAVELIADFDAAATRAASSAIDPDLLWDLRAHLGVDRYAGRKSRVDLSPEQLGWIIRSFRGLWPATSHPGSSTGSSNPWDATDFINWAITRLGEDVGEMAAGIVADLKTVEDGYLVYIQVVAAEQRQRMVETRYRPPSLQAIADALNEGTPANAAKLQAVLLEALDAAQARLKGDRLDWYKGFYSDDGAHKGEEACRDELLKMLDGKVAGVELRPESHFADDKRVDIECSVNPMLMVPVEVKGQWHKAIWTAADDQLDKLYSADWRADRRGIYLILWFGGPTELTKPPAGMNSPTTPEELKAALVANSEVCMSGLVEVFVLDLTRP